MSPPSETELSFPAFGDADLYEQLGAQCADALTGSAGSLLDGCSGDGLRPIGTSLYYAIPHVVSSDPVVVSYLALTLNLLVLFCVYAAFRSLFIGSAAEAAPVDSRGRWFLEATVVGIIAVNCVGQLPVRLADLPALALFAAALVVASRSLTAVSTREKHLDYLKLGLLVCASTLLKQTYVVYGGLLLIATLLLDAGCGDLKSLARRTGWYCLGMSPVVLQFFAVYAKSGRFWLYDPAEVAVFGPANQKPVVELVAFSLPFKSAYLVRVANQVSDLSFFQLKLFKGMFEFELPVYQGYMPYPADWTVSGTDLLLIWILGLAYLAITALTVWRAPAALKLAALSGVLAALFTAWMGHAEYRYFLYPRIVLWFLVVYWLVAGTERAWRRFR